MILVTKFVLVSCTNLSMKLAFNNINRNYSNLLLFISGCIEDGHCTNGEVCYIAKNVCIGKFKKFSCALFPYTQTSFCHRFLEGFSKGFSNGFPKIVMLKISKNLGGVLHQPKGFIGVLWPNFSLKFTRNSLKWHLASLSFYRIFGIHSLIQTFSNMWLQSNFISGHIFPYLLCCTKFFRFIIFDQNIHQIKAEIIPSW